MAISTINSSGLNQAGDTVLCTTSGSVGIGTSSPTEKLHVNSGAGNVPALFESTDPIAVVQFKDNNSTLFNAVGVQTNDLIFYSGGNVNMRLDPSGNLGLGVSPSAWYTGYTASQIGVNGSVWANRTTADTNIVGIGSNQFLNSGATNRLYISNGFATRYEQANGAHSWFTAPSGTAGNAISFTQAMTLDSSGSLLVGGTSFAQGGIVGSITASATGTLIQLSTNTTGSKIQMQFNNPNGQVGYILTNGSGTTYATSSDYRLKYDIQPMTGALAKVAALKPCIYKWNADDSAGEGFIAHELAEVCPSAVTGEKDAVDAEGNPQYQGIDTSFLVATLTSAIQELKAIVDAQGAEIAALKGQP